MMLEVKNLVKKFPIEKGLFAGDGHFVHAVDDVSFEVGDCETVGLVGESGCGKSTIGRAILNLINIDSGNIVLFGKDIHRIKKEELRKIRKSIQIIFQFAFVSP